MRKFFVLAAVAGISSVLVWWGIAWGAMNGPAVTFRFTKFASKTDQMGCKAVAAAMLNEEVDFGSPSNKYGGNLKVAGARGTDTLSLKVDRSARKLLVISGASVGIGAIEPEEMTLVRDDSNVLVAVQIIPVSGNVFVLRLNRQTGNAVWGKVGDLIGVQNGWIQYLECR